MNLIIYWGKSMTDQKTHKPVYIISDSPEKIPAILALTPIPKLSQSLSQIKIIRHRLLSAFTDPGDQAKQH